MKTTVTLLCGICLNEEDSKTAGPWVTLGACGHCWHTNCIKRWTSPPRGSGMRKSVLCPTCRTKILHPGGQTSLSRFTRLIFDGEPVDHPSDTSSSPAREASARKRRAIVEDDDEEEEGMEEENGGNAEDAATESESDEENARPARRFQAGNNAVAGPSRLGAGAGAENTDGNNSEMDALRAQLKDLRDAQRTSREKIARLEHELAVQSAREEEETREYQQQLSEAQDERHAADQRVRQVNDAMKEEREISKKLKEDKKGLTKSLKMEVDKVTKLRDQVSRLTSELSKLKESNADLKTKHDNLVQSSKENEADAESRSTHHERLKATVQRLLETKTTYETKLNSKRERIAELEAEVKALRARLGPSNGQTAPAAASKKGKGRAENQDENLADPTVFAQAHAAPASPVSSRQVISVSEKPKRKRVITIDDEDSLMILDDDAHPAGADGQEDSMDFADLDAGLLGASRRPSRPLTAKKLSSSSSSSNTRPSVKTEAGKSGAAAAAAATTVSRFFKPAEGVTTATQGKQVKLEKSNSDKWADMALGLGAGGKSGNTATGAKKRVKTGF